MGINGLLKVLESISCKRHLKEYEGKRVAVDGYCWLHKSMYTMAQEILENPNSTRRIEQLLKYRIKPVMVFDGDKLPMKKEEEDEREKHRKETKIIAKDCLKRGDVSMARQKMIEAIDINPRMAYNFIKLLQQRGIEYFVAPYEADAQLAYLSKIGYVDLVITEDSDLLALGCQRVLFKLDLEIDYGNEIYLPNLPKCKDYDFTRFSHDKFLHFCILCGCDYFKLRGVGVKTAYHVIKDRNSYKESLQMLRNGTKHGNFPINMEEDFEKAFLTFKFQVIYCPQKKKMRYYNEVNDTIYTFLYNFKDLSFLGKPYNDDLATQIVFAVIDPISHLPFECKENSRDKEEEEQENTLQENQNDKKDNDTLLIQVEDQNINKMGDFPQMQNQQEIEEVKTNIYISDTPSLIDQKSDNENQLDTIQQMAMAMKPKTIHINERFNKRKFGNLAHVIKNTEEYHFKNKKFKFATSSESVQKITPPSERFINTQNSTRFTSSSSPTQNFNKINEEQIESKSVKSNDSSSDEMNKFDMFLSSYSFANEELKKAKNKDHFDKVKIEVTNNKVLVKHLNSPVNNKLSQNYLSVIKSNNENEEENIDKGMSNDLNKINPIPLKFDEYNYDGSNEDFLQREFVPIFSGTKKKAKNSFL